MDDVIVSVVVVQPFDQSVVVSAPPSRVVVGTPGPQGPSGTGGGAAIFTQSSPAATWIVTHNLGRLPILEVYVGGQQVTADILETSSNVATIVFATPQTGEVVYS